MAHLMGARRPRPCVICRLDVLCYSLGSMGAHPKPFQGWVLWVPRLVRNEGVRTPHPIAASLQGQDRGVPMDPEVRSELGVLCFMGPTEQQCLVKTF